MNGLRVFYFSAICLTAFVAGDNFAFRQNRVFHPSFKLFPPIPNSMHGFGSSSMSQSSSSVVNGHPETITNTQVTGSATANANAQIDGGFGLNNGFQSGVVLGTGVEEKPQPNCHKEESHSKNNGSENKDPIHLPEQGGFGENCNCICKGIKFFGNTDTNNEQSSADFNVGINTRFGTSFESNGIHKSGTFPKGPSRGISSSSSAQSFPDGSGSFEVSATKITA